jgi:hypothetical protein
VGTGKLVSVSGISISGTDAGNYSLASTTASTTANITPAPLTIKATTNTKIYNGTTSAAAVPMVAGLYAPDTVTGLAETYDNPSVAGSPTKTLSVAAYTVNDGNGGGDYLVTLVSSATGVINPANATIVVTAYSVIYDGKAHTATGTATGVSGANLSPDLNLSGTTHTNVGTYNNDPWTFTDPSGNYNPASGAVSDAILWKFTLIPLKTPANLGSSVPINWTLQDAYGNYITSLSTLVRLESVFNGPVPGGGCVASLIGVYQTLYSLPIGAEGNSSFRYSSSFTLNWGTSTATSTGKGCYTVKVSLNDGTAKMTNAAQLK